LSLNTANTLYNIGIVPFVLVIHVKYLLLDWKLGLVTYFCHPFR